MAGNPLRRLAPAIALVFLSTLVAAGVPAGAVTTDNNPDIPNQCGLNVSLVLDRSGSIANADAESQVRNSAKAFLNAVDGTGSTVSLVTFATSASVNLAPTTNIASAVAAVDAITDAQFTGATNWEDALIKAKGLDFDGVAGAPVAPADLVVMITDGNPTTYNGDTTNSGGSTSTTDVSKAVTQADAIKLAGSHMFAVGVTAAPTVANLAAISGPDQYPVPEPSINKGDWTKVSSFADLQAALRKIALDLCAQSVTVHKLIGGAHAVAPWQFTATQGTAQAQVKSTDALGNTLPFEWVSAQPVTVTIVETAQAGYALDSVVCSKSEGQVVVATTAVVGGATLSVGPQDNIDCYFDNVRQTGTLTVKKVLSPITDPGTFNLLVDGNTAGLALGHNDSTAAITVNTGDHTFGETAAGTTNLANYTPSSACVAGGQSVTLNLNGSVPVANGQAVVCTITNTRQTGTLTVKKALSPDTDPGTFNLLIDGNIGATAVGHDGSTLATKVTTGSHTFGEAGAGATNLANYTPSSVCVGGVQTGTTNNWSVSVANDQNVVCTITNTRQTGTLTVKKVLSPTTDPGTFNLLIDGNTAGLALGHNDSTAAITVNTGDHTFGETAAGTTNLANYTPSSACVAGGQSVTLNTNGSVPVANGQAVVCTITNTRNTGSLTVTKVAQGGDGDFTFDVVCDTVSFLNRPITLNSEGHGQFIIEGIPTNTDCTVTEDDAPLFNSSSLPDDGKVTIHSGESALVAFLNSAKPDGIIIDKKVNGADHSTIGDALLAHVGDTLTYTVAVTNNGQVPLTIEALSDSLAPGFAAACPHLGSVLDVGDSFTCTYTVTAAVDANNVASVTGSDDLDRSVTASDSTYVDVIHPSVTIVKTASPLAATVGDTVTFSYLVSNTGDAVLSNVTVNDDVLGLVGTIASLAPGASTTLTKTMVATLTSALTNVGTIKGTDPLGLEIKASDDATITVAALPEIVVAAKDPPLVLGIEVVAPPAAAPATELPRTGSETSRLLLMGEMALLAGLASLLLAAAARRRKANLN
jgi:uncharacterized repeat protein (TIGR01451 family)